MYAAQTLFVAISVGGTALTGRQQIYAAHQSVAVGGIPQASPDGGIHVPPSGYLLVTD